MIIKNFCDKDNSIYDITMRGGYQDSIKSSRKLKQIIDSSTSFEGLKKLHPTYPSDLINKLSIAYQRKTYKQIMSIFGIISNAIYKGKKRII
jgi:hypothetical protein